MPVPGRLDAVGRCGVYHHNRGSVTDQHVDDHIHDHIHDLNDDHNDDHDHNDDYAGTDHDHHIQRRQLIRHQPEEYTV
ncbi:MAG: hypothetical protein OEM84_12445 [Acidimicrobiia bacterium]|nr:hypothetical protein [Acidimicrobiia bacterium]